MRHGFSSSQGEYGGNDGSSGPYEVDYRCKNTNCENINVVFEVAMYDELGNSNFVDEDAPFCKYCGLECEEV